MKHYLAILTRDCAPDAWRRLIEQTAGDCAVHVLADPLSTYRFEDEGRNIVWLDHEWNPYGGEAMNVWNQADELVSAAEERIFKRLRPDSFFYGQVNLWHVTKIIQTATIVYPAMQLISVLQKVLHRRKWDRLYFLGNPGEMESILFRLIAEQEGCQPDIISLTRPTPTLNWKGRLLNRLPLQCRLLARFSRSPFIPDSLSSSLPKGDQPLFLCLVRSALAAYRDNAISVMRQLSSQGRCVVLSDGDARGEALVKEAGFEVVHSARQLSFAARTRAFFRASRLMRYWPSLIRDRDSQDTFNYHGVPFWPAIASQYEKMYATALPEMMLWIHALPRILDILRPNAILGFPGESWHGHLLSLLSTARQIPTLTVQNTMYAELAEFRPVYMDRVAVIDEYAKQLYVKRTNMSEECVSITGLPRWDSLASMETPVNEGSVRRELGLGANEKVVVFASQWIRLTETTRMIRSILRAIADSDSPARLLIKVHPAESERKYDCILEQLQPSAPLPVVTKEVSLQSVLAIADLVASGFSSSVMEAAIAGKPVLVINLSGEADILPYAQQGIALCARTEEEATQQCRSLLDGGALRERLGETRRQFFRENPQLVDGKSSLRVAELAYRLGHDPGMDNAS